MGHHIVLKLLLQLTLFRFGGDYYGATVSSMKMVHWLLIGELLRLVQRGGECAGYQLTHFLSTVPHVTVCLVYQSYIVL